MDQITNTGQIAAERLASFVERLEKLHEDKDAIGADIKEVFAEAKGAGFDTNVIKSVLKDRKLGEGACAERDALIEVYKRALGMFADTPLGQAALRRL